MDRMEYADQRRDQYLDWCYQIEQSPYDWRDKLEWAIISAHTKFEPSINGFMATRGIESLDGIAEALAWHSVIGPRNKAAYIMDLREALDGEELPIPHPDYAWLREHVKYPGLGHCKLSFACCLIDPFASNVVCLDTHILQVYLGRKPGAQEVARHYRSLGVYTTTESRLLAEADELGLPPFAYQWATWDWKRAKLDHIPPENHSFLWRSGRDSYQMPLFSGTE